VLEVVGLPAGLLLGPMAVAIIVAALGRGFAVPPPLPQGAQAMVGLLIAPSIDWPILRTVAHQPWLFGGVTLATITASAALGWLLARLAVLPRSTAIWGSMPGAATAMVLIARDQGAEWRLVAVMSYLRVICVALLASVLAALVSGHGGAHPPGGAWFPRLDPPRLGETVAVAFLGAWGGRRLGLPAAALIGPLLLGVALGLAGVPRPQLPGWLLAPAYLLVGWRIGLAFTPEILREGRRAAPRLLVATGTLVLFCAALAWPLARVTGTDLVTAYLATSPGGADSVAIIAQATPVDVPFVMAMQMLRFMTVLLVGPPLARAVARRMGDGQRREPGSGTAP
jgi:hypothetical protein